MTRTTYFWDELTDNVIMESDDKGNVTTYTQVPELHGRVLSQDRNGERSHFHYDGQGNVRQVTDSAGNVTDEMTYAAFGKGQLNCHGGWPGRFAFVGASRRSLASCWESRQESTDKSSYQSNSRGDRCGNFKLLEVWRFATICPTLEK